ncbi:hypothetical protein EBI_27579 [Enterocytozoon bieneusi H348]|nr:hypothetical protein EBI_27579 [Enterocytozoon bieneusi H348]|eukprot:XP_002650949.1 hypothetical protein EBI_27579 [Enterocytozoon bieneusi H348]
MFGKKTEFWEKRKIFFFFPVSVFPGGWAPLGGDCPHSKEGRDSLPCIFSHFFLPKARPCWSHSLATAAQGFSTICPFASSAKNLFKASFFFFYLSGLQASL